MAYTLRQLIDMIRTVPDARTVLQKMNDRVESLDSANYGDIVNYSVGTYGEKVPLLNTENTWSKVQTFTGGMLGNASTASKLKDSRTISIAGDAFGSALFDGSANASISINSSKFVRSYTTLNGANANIANIAVGQFIQVPEGLYEKLSDTATTLTKSAYDPATQAKNYSDSKTYLKESPNKLFSLADKNGVTVVTLYTDGSLYIKGLETDIVSKFSSVNGLIDTINNFLSSHIYNGSSTEKLFDLKDLNGQTVFKINSNGDTYLPKLGNLNAHIDEMQTQINKALSVSALSAQHSAGKYSDYALAEVVAAQDKRGTVITAADINALGVLDYTTTLVRIPSMQRIGKNKYINFVDARDTADDFGIYSNVAFVTTVDPVTFNITVSNLQVLHKSDTDAQGNVWSYGQQVAVLLDSGRILALHFGRSGSTRHKIFKQYSDDGGVTWSAPIDIGNFFNMAFYNLLCPTSAGIVKRYGTNKGRIIFPTWYSTQTYITANQRAGYVYSDDGGETWQAGQFLTEATNETTVSEDINGDLLFLVRREGAPPLLYRMRDGTTNYELMQTNIVFNNVVNLGVLGCIMQGENKFDGSSAKLQICSAQSFGNERKGLKLFTSYDGGYNWVSYDFALDDTLIWYSNIQRLDTNRCLLTYETGSGGVLAYAIVSLKTALGV